jgi:glycosyltransferase involved in cell wall biosynthesis
MAPIPQSSSRVPRISVVMALYNRAPEVGAALESVLAQDHEDYEVVVVDDGSTDGGPDVVRRFGDQVRLIVRANGGVGAARNAGIAAARGEYLAYCDADDVQLPFRLRAQALLLDRFPRAAMVFSDFRTWTRGEVVTGDSHLRTRWLGPTVRTFEAELTEAFREVHTCRSLEVPVPTEYRDRRVLVGEVAPLVARMHVAWGCVQMSRTEAVRAVGGHWEGVRAYEDWCLTSELSKRHPLIFMDLPTCVYRVHPEQLTGRPRLNAECYRDVVERTWAGDPDFSARHPELVALLRGSAHAMLGEIDATDGRWAEAEASYARALRAWPRLKRTYLNLALASARHRIPGFAAGPLGRRLPAYLKPRDEPRG